MSIKASSLSPGMFFQFHSMAKDGRFKPVSADYQVLSIEAQTRCIKILQLHWAEPILFDPESETLIHLSHGGAIQGLPYQFEIVPIDFYKLPHKQRQIALLYQTRVLPRELVPGEWFQMWHDSQWKQLGYPKQLQQLDGSLMSVYRLRSGNVRTYRTILDETGRLTCDFHRLDPRSSAYCDFYKRKQEEGVKLGTGIPTHRDLYHLAQAERPYDKDVFLMVDEQLKCTDMTHVITDYLEMEEPPRNLIKKPD